MALYDDAKIMFLASAAAGLETKDASKLYNVKPVETLSSTQIVQGGDFSDASQWTLDSNVTIADNKVTFAGSGTQDIYQASGITLANKKVKVTFTAHDITAGSVNAIFYSTGGTSTVTPSISTNGNHSAIVTIDSSANNNVGLRGSTDFRGKISNFSVREVTAEGADFTISRDANLDATRVGPTGLIEKGRENLAHYSNNFSTTSGGGGWGHIRISSLSTGQDGYDGTTNATAIFSAANSGKHQVVIGTANSLPGEDFSITGVFTLSVHAKPNGYDHFILRSDVANINASFNIATGVVGTRGSKCIASSMTAVGNGFYRCQATFSHSGSVEFLAMGMMEADDTTDFTGSTSKGYILQDAQLEVGLTATDFIPSTGTPGTAGIKEDEPRFDYPLAGGPPSLLIEPQRKNEVPNSEGVVESTNNVTLTVNHGIAPDGTKSSLKVAKGGDSNDRIQPISNDNVTLTNSADYSISAFVKNIDCTGVTTIACRTDAGSNELFRQGFQWTGASLALTSDQASGTRTGAFVESYGNDWWRIGFTFTANSTAGNFEIDIDRENGSATTSIETWGWQLEKETNGGMVTSYIPCHGAAATRSQDVFPELTHGITLGTAVTVLLEAQLFGGGGQVSYLQLRIGTDSVNRFLFFSNGSSLDSTHDINVQHRESDTNKAIQKTGLTRGDIFKCIGRVDGTTFNVFVNGVKLGTTHTVVAADIYDKISLIRNGDVTNQSGHKNKSVVVWASALTDQQCIDLTTL